MISSRIATIVSLCVAGFVLGQDTELLPYELNLENDRDANVKSSRIGIIVSPLMAWNKNRMLEIYWMFSGIPDDDDRLSLYEGYPGSNGSKSLYTFAPKHRKGVRKTKTRSDFFPTEKLRFTARCLKYYVIWHRKNYIRKLNCMATHPDWMSLRRETLGSKRLNEIFIPGTHDSGSFTKEEPSKFESVLNIYAITQDEDILSQLIYGVRYLDIRVGRHPGTDVVFWANHGYFAIHELSWIIDDVKTFIDNTQEIVIFDIHRFPIGFSYAPMKAHKELIMYLKKEFAGYYLTKASGAWGMSLNDIWATGKRLIISYNRGDVWPRYGSTWEPVTHLWPDVTTMDELYTKINEYETTKKPANDSSLWNLPPTSVMAQFTPGALDMVLNRLGGLRIMSDLVNMNVTFNYHEKWRCTANIVSMDYIKASGIIEAALEWNDRRPDFC